MGGELGTLRRPLAWVLLALAGIQLLVPAVPLLLHAVDRGLEMIGPTALGTANVATGFPFVLLPLAAVLLARGSAAAGPVRRVAAALYATALALGVVSLVLVSTQGEAVFGGVLVGGSGVHVLSQLAELGVVGVALIVSWQAGRRQPQ